ncbi:hypothetical protein SLEP1_g54441 [Rubroshorea leprosula]|uniref:DNA-(apurinic or apyrimidinic site) endonuclease n=1 Tax=Rubroshorea leprosula TaxID=152421 RepID=A0AAV5MCD7_9ROSI|nr:hypothetical protein SLEP1_g54441 [Rubroshorea leprosula]
MNISSALCTYPKFFKAIDDRENKPQRSCGIKHYACNCFNWNAGLPAKGCKSDLVSALKSYLDKQLDGESSHLEDEQLSSISAQSISLTGKTKTLSGELDAKIVMKGKKLSIKEKKPSQAIRKASLVIDGKDTNDGVNVPMSQTSGHAVFPNLANLVQQLYPGSCQQIKPLSVRYGLGISDQDSEGRLVTAEFDTFYLLSAYVPNSGDGLRRLPYRITEWDQSLGNCMKELEKSKPVILTGDLNCAHEEMDIYDPICSHSCACTACRCSLQTEVVRRYFCNLFSYRLLAGFTNEERHSFGTNFISRGFVDTFRKQHPDVVGYTYWGYRHDDCKTNRGWRLDYFLVSESVADKVYDSYILPDVTGSDHCPIGLILTP